MLYFWHSVGNWMLTLLSNMLTNLNMTDMETCYKAFRREVIQAIRLEKNLLPGRQLHDCTSETAVLAAAFDSFKEYFTKHHKARKPSVQPIFLPSWYV